MSDLRHNVETRRLAANRLCVSVCFPKSLIPNERLRVSDWIVQRLYYDAVKETVEL